MSYPFGGRSHYSVIIVGGGQAGLSLSHCLQQRGVDHLVIEKRSLVHSWRTQRWDSFCLVTPNWQCQLPGWGYLGDDPHGFMVKEQINEWLAGFVAHVKAPAIEGVTVERVSRNPATGERERFSVQTDAGTYTADQVVVASGGYHRPIVPRLAEKLPPHVAQYHSAQYRNAAQLPEGAVLVVGCGQSGAQIAEDLHLAGRKVHLATGNAPRCARFYRGREVVDWLADMKYYDMPVTEHPLREGVRDNTNHYVTGRDGGRDIDLRRFAQEGMELYGLLSGFDGRSFELQPNLRDNLDSADATYNRINASIDKFIATQGIEAPPPSVYTPVWEPAEERTRLDLAAAGITSVVWCIGFSPDFEWVDAPVFNGRGAPVHRRGVTNEPGLYFLGLPWLHTWGSGRFSGVARDAEFLTQAILQRSDEKRAGGVTAAVAELRAA
ncbi:putative flavoprotein involved in K+ transport [Variovorax boronicumulans]|uniref:Flavoprotein involved in K+ transport n=1 Tax=Variovorax boronicumulans TaxID=436515 RepID=A0AAW8DV95_9BURK|nr:MSMEG_0569 family flavin-dependent oxidoreductase [Variovorax boronicumulans]MDP9877892.1 putative flavoprotein involved in K+ transport [Variovorax boronicumulans]MDP9923176.1 putative flavoprotein involved in K+ transport [Variovorax boronicumulans]